MRFTARWCLLGSMGLIFAGVGLAADAASPAAFPKGRAGTQYSWQTMHAKVLETGNLEWSPKPFAFEKGDSVRYIDYEAGKDSNAGTSKESPWKHHPWDAKASGTAKACKGIHTYVFKGGVIYRGALKATDSGKAGNPIRLTCDPSWGQGRAAIYGSTQIKGGWKKASAAEAPGIPQPEQIWYIDLGRNYDPDRERAAEEFYHAKFSSIWQVQGDKVERLHIARQPNYDLSDPNNPVKNWPVWKGYNRKTKTLTSPVLKNLGDKSTLKGAVIWTEASFLMAAASKTSVRSYDPQKGTVQLKSRADLNRIPRAKVHFMIENVSRFLDAAGEYFFDLNGPKAGRLYLRPANGVDPNTVVYEVAQTRIPLWIQDQSYITISGLEFRYNDPEDGTYDWPPQVGASPCVRIIGNCTDITVQNCRFYYVANAVVAFPRPENQGGPYGVYRKEIGDFANDVMDNIIIQDNDVAHVEKYGAIYVTGASQRKPGQVWGKLKRVEVMRNRVRDTGFRHGRFGNSSIPAISVVMPETCEIAGNIVDTSFGNGIFTLGGKGSGSHNDVPLTRMLVYNNQIDNTMLGCNDYGGLEHFQGGPIYIFNNITRNCVGNRTLGQELGYSLYLDGGFKCYCFNNIIAGNVKPDQPDYYNHCGYFMVFGFMDQLFNNTIYRFERALDGSSGNRSNILGNLMLECHKTFIGQNRPGDVSMLGGGDTGEMGRTGIPTMAYAWNVFYGNPKGSKGPEDAFGYVGGTSSTGSGRGAPVQTGATLEELRDKLEKEKCRLASLGWHVKTNPITAPDKKDYRPAANSEARERGVKYFVPWALYGVVGEWNFFKSASAPDVVLGEGFYMTDEYVSRDMYYHIPRNDLKVSSCTADDYVAGPLEDWIEGALRFDGKSRFAVLTHADMAQDRQYKKFAYKGSRRKTVDMGTNNFLIEVVFQAEAGHTGGVLVSKEAGSGYGLGITDSGAIKLELKVNGAAACARTSATRVNDGAWHHVIAEVDRKAAQGITIYVDGKETNDAWTGTMPSQSLANTGDFLVGKGSAGNYFNGRLDFLRVSRGTLADAKTTIAELYAWEFNGPHLRDFAGQPVTGARRDAGALESAR